MFEIQAKNKFEPIILIIIFILSICAQAAYSVGNKFVTSEELEEKIKQSKLKTSFQGSDQKKYIAYLYASKVYCNVPH